MDLGTAVAGFAFLRLRFNAELTQFDIFADALTQRTEADTGTWLAGLDSFAADAMDVPGGYFEPPPVMCYLDRGHGAAIRRARTRLPGGGENPVAVIRVPRERMVGSGIASSLVHEVGHQVSASLGLPESIRPDLAARARTSGPQSQAWGLWSRWISETLADFWSVARVGVASTLGLMGVVSLPKPFVFRLNLDDPHPVPWIRVRASCAFGRELYPHPQWERLERLWESYYPLSGLDAPRTEIFKRLASTLPAFAALLANHRPRSLGGKSLREVLDLDRRRPEALVRRFEEWGGSIQKMALAAPSLVFAALGQVRLEGRLSAVQEGRLVARLLTSWAMRDTLRAAEAGARARSRRGRPASRPTPNRMTA